jgi:hypothetical protein
MRADADQETGLPALLWRLHTIRILWALAGLFGLALALLSDKLPDQWFLVFLLTYLFSTIAIAIRGLVVIRQTVAKGG